MTEFDAFVQITTPYFEGNDLGKAVYVRPSAITLIGPMRRHPTYGNARKVYIKGGTPFLIEDTPENMRALFGRDL